MPVSVLVSAAGESTTVSYFPPGSTTMLAGASSNDYVTLEAKSGRQSVVRVYDPSNSYNISAMAAKYGPPDLTNRVLIASCQPPAAAGKTWFANWFATAPKFPGLRIVPAIHHEASNPLKAFTTAAQQAVLRQDNIDMASVAHDVGFEPGWIEMAYCWQNSGAVSAGRPFTNWYPGDGIMDWVFADAYNEGSLAATQRADAPGLGVGYPVAGESKAPVGGGYFKGGFVPWAQGAQASGAIKGWGLAEWGSIRTLTAPAGAMTRAQWLTAGADEYAGWGCGLLTLFDCAGRTWAGPTGESWQLKNDTTGADFAAWGAIAAKY